ncbi:hypothetical protein HDU96_009713, partial [Phlyctochytrium bullatum]
NLGGRDVYSALPSTISRLEALRALNLRGCSLRGPIPSALGSLINLHYLDFTDNNLSGTIPRELGNLTELTYLSIEQNGLTGMIPEELGNLRNLTGLLIMRAQSDCDSFFLQVPSLSTSTAPRIPTSSIPVAASSSAVSVAGVTSATDAAQPSSSSNSTLAVIASALGGTLLLLTITIIAAFFLRKRRAARRLASLEQDLPPLKSSPDRPLTSQNSQNTDLLSARPRAASLPTPGKPAIALFLGLTETPQDSDPSLALQAPEKPAGALFTDVKESREAAAQQPVRAELRPRPVFADSSSTFTPTAVTSSSEQSDPVRPARSATTSTQRTIGVSGGGIAAERAARSRIAVLSPVEVGEELLRMGVGPGLVSALEENGVSGGKLLVLTNAELLAMGIQEWYSRDLVLRTIPNLVASEQERVERTASISGRGEDLPTYSQ